MQLRKWGLLLLALVMVGLPAVPVHASYLNGNEYAAMATRRVKITRTVHVYRVRTGKYEAANRFTDAGYVHKGAHVKISHWLMSAGSVWVIKSPHKYTHNSRTFFVVAAKGHHWYRKY
ncbi:hypothetical protein [Levilactobacillus wangkuiensis]|uniref:hypothetical protein n=1 Tax=Levilactobacillus wangkuiensis TaxID=2799566 RepID=UPI0019409B7B|nr:hypothetical protein [Levilactobacillus wangkuiensis]